MSDSITETVAGAFRQTVPGLPEGGVRVQRYANGAFVAVAEHNGLRIDATRTVQGEIQVRYMDRSTQAHAYAEHGLRGEYVRILGGETEGARDAARDAAGALVGRLVEAFGRPTPIARPSLGP